MQWSILLLLNHGYLLKMTFNKTLMFKDLINFIPP